MKVHVKTLSKKSLFIDIEDTKSVLELKKELSLYPDVGVDAELQRLIYAGKILANEDPLAMYNIDTSKFLVVMTVKKPDAAVEAVPSPKEEVNVEEAKPEVTTSPASETKDVPVIPAEKSENEKMVDSIVSMGYPESEVRQALAASFYNPERAIEYLIDGIPSSTAPDAGEVRDFDLTNLQRMQQFIQRYPDMLQQLLHQERMRRPHGSDLQRLQQLSQFIQPIMINERMRRHGSDDLQRLRQFIQRHPDMLQQLALQIGDSDPNVNPQSVLDALYNSGEEDDDDDDDD